MANSQDYIEGQIAGIKKLTWLVLNELSESLPEKERKRLDRRLEKNIEVIIALSYPCQKDYKEGLESALRDSL